MTGGISDKEEPANAEIQALVEEVKDQITGKMNASFNVFEPISYKTQVVAGRNYFVKARNLNTSLFYSICKQLVNCFHLYRFMLVMINASMLGFIEISSVKSLSIPLKKTKPKRTPSLTFNLWTPHPTSFFITLKLICFIGEKKNVVIWYISCYIKVENTTKRDHNELRLSFSMVKPFDNSASNSVVDVFIEYKLEFGRADEFFWVAVLFRFLLICFWRDFPLFSAY